MNAKNSVHPYVKANFLSRLFFCWLNDILKKGSHKELVIGDIYEVLPNDSSSIVCERLEKNWKQELKKTEIGQKPSLIKALVKTYGPCFMIWIIIFVIEEVMHILCPFFIGGLINHFSRGSESSYIAYMYGLGICLSAIIPTIMHHPYFVAIFKSGMRMRLSCCTLIYKKLMRLNLVSLDSTAVGKVVNLMSNDVIRFDLTIGLLPFLLVGPPQVIIVSIIFWFYIGWSGICGMAVLLLVIPFSGALAKLFAKLRAQTTVLTDKRLCLMTEVLNGIQLIKMFCWESYIERVVINSRMAEVRKLYKASYSRGSNLATSFYSGKLIVLFTFLTYVLTGNVITAEVVFVTLSLYNHVRLNMTLGFPMALQFGAETTVTLQRIQEFLLLEERPVLMIANEINPNVNSMSFIKTENLTISYGPDKTPILTNLNFDARERDLFMVVGPVGSGKTSLLLAILKELPIFQGKMNISGNIAFVPQSYWIFNSSIKNNIIMGLHFNEEFYTKVLKYAALEKDLECLPEKDETIVGERGMSLSGGQKARIALARALYMDSDIYLLDSPLSAVDANVGHFLFHRCINEFLAKKLRILVTHQLQYLSYASKILIIDKSRNHVFGSYTELLTMGIDFVQIFKDLKDVQDTETICESKDIFKVDFALSKNISKSLSHLKKRYSGELQERLLTKSNVNLNSRKTSNGSLISWSSRVLDGSTLDVQEGAYHQNRLGNVHQETVLGSSVSAKMYMTYYRAGGGMAACIICLLLNLSAQASFLVTDWWIAHWCQSVETFINARKVNLSENLCSSNISCYNAANSSSNVTPHEAELIFPHTNFYLVIFALLSLLVVLFGLLRALQFSNMAISSSNDLHGRMLYAVLRSPMTFFVDTPTGQVLNRFSKDLGQADDYLPLQMLDLMQSTFQVIGVFVIVSLANPWVILAVIPILICFYFMRKYFLKTFRTVKRLEAISKSPVFSHVNNTFQGLHTIRCHKAEEYFIKEYNSLQDINTSAFCLFLYLGRWLAVRLEWLCTVLICVVTFASLAANQFVSGSTIGLSLTYVISLLWLFQWVVRQSTEVEGLMTSVERIHEYSKLPIEDVISHNIPPKWPENGKIDFRNVSLKYKSEASDALHHVTFTITPGERVGVVGRTGAGKSSLINVLFRLFDFEGTVMIDEVDHRTINLHHLRKKLSIIPQDPTLFAGLLRTNLDPLAQHSDPQLWHALKKVDLDETIGEMKEGLYFMVQEGGKNLSVGQRQLLCMARALLENNKILIIDEATANVDRATDTLIQQKLREEFADCTVMCIAHRLNTVMDYDKILVMESGEVREHGTPHNLMQVTDGALHNLARQCGEKEFQELLEAAKAHRQT